METVWVLGDQLNRRLGPLAAADPSTTRVLLVESTAKLTGRRWHRQRVHLVMTAMRRFAAELTAEGFEVDLRVAPTLRAGLTAHTDRYRPTRVRAMEPASWDGLAMLQRAGVELVRSDQFLCHRDDFAAWADGRGTRRLLMEDFYRRQRRRLGYLMDGDEPAGGRWNFDHDNRRPPPKGAHPWPVPPRDALDDVDRAVLADLDARGVQTWGADPDGTWATSREGAVARLDHVMTEVLPHFGPYEDAMLAGNWHLAHTMLSPLLNLGLLLPGEVCDAAEAAYRRGDVPIASAEGFVRQVIGWREYVWGVYWHQMPGYRDRNALDARRPLPPALRDGRTEMRCVASVHADVAAHGWTHHIPRLMVLGNLALLAGIDPAALTEWMWSGFVDGAEWVMLPNVGGMATWADGGLMATKPYAAGGAYIHRMSDFCGGCRYDRRRRTGEDACPFTTLYWDFLARHREVLVRNPRIAQQVRAADRLADLPAVRARAAQVLDLLERGTL